MRWLLVSRGLVLCLLVGRWNGMRPRPTKILPSDISYGLHRDVFCIVVAIEFPLQNSEELSFELEQLLRFGKLGL